MSALARDGPAKRGQFGFFVSSTSTYSASITSPWPLPPDGFAPPLAFPGLTGRESVVLQALMELHDASRDALQRQTGIAELELRPLVEHLLALGFIGESIHDGETTYRYRAQPGDTPEP